MHEAKNIAAAKQKNTDEYVRGFKRNFAVGFNVQSRLLQVLADPCWPLPTLQTTHMSFNDTCMAQKRLQSKKSDAAGMFFWNQLRQSGNKDLDGYSICTYRVQAALRHREQSQAS